jgi:outer membrane protein OmpA-like peptidoglycan-associated protein
MRLVYVGSDDSGDTWDLYIANIDGSHPARLTHNGTVQAPAWLHPSAALAPLAQAARPQGPAKPPAAPATGSKAAGSAKASPDKPATAKALTVNAADKAAAPAAAAPSKASPAPASATAAAPAAPGKASPAPASATAAAPPASAKASPALASGAAQGSPSGSAPTQPSTPASQSGTAKPSALPAAAAAPAPAAAAQAAKPAAKAAPLKISVAVHFVDGGDRIDQASLPTLAKLATRVKQYAGDQIRVQGPLDASALDPRYASATDRSLARAQSVRDWLCAQCGIPASGVDALPYTPPVLGQQEQGSGLRVIIQLKQ